MIAYNRLQLFTVSGDIVCLHIVTFGCVWLFSTMALFSYLESSENNLFKCALLCMALYDGIQLCSAVYDFVCICRTVHM